MVARGVLRSEEKTPIKKEFVYSPKLAPPPTPEAGSQHSTLTPWGVGVGWRIKHNMAHEDGADRVTLFNAWWTQRGHMWTLDPFVTFTSIPPELKGLYHKGESQDVRVDGGWLINIDLCPQDARDWFPSFHMEANAKELEGLLPWARTLYEWIQAEDKYRLKMAYRAWHRDREAEELDAS